jgi:hypothetical protein
MPNKCFTGIDCNPDPELCPATCPANIQPKPTPAKTCSTCGREKMDSSCNTCASSNHWQPKPTSTVLKITPEALKQNPGLNLVRIAYEVQDVHTRSEIAKWICDKPIEGTELVVKVEFTLEEYNALQKLAGGK